MTGHNKRRLVSHLARLTPRQVRQARRLLNTGHMQADVAARLGVSQSTISNLEWGKTYKRVR